MRVFVNVNVNVNLYSA